MVGCEQRPHGNGLVDAVELFAGEVGLKLKVFMVLGGVATILAATQFAPPVAGLFAFAPLAWQEIALVALGSAAVLVLLERIKRGWRIAGS